jgi:peptidoglycan hydrolase CwlO-like protein
MRHDLTVATKKKQSKVSAKNDLRAVVKKLRSQLAKAEKSAEKWKSRAKAHQSDAAGLKAELTVVRRRLDKATASATKWKGRARSAAPASTSAAAAEPASTTAPERGAVSGAAPDDSWTVTRLRAEARARGVAGYSRKTKEQLLVDLRG